MTPSPTSAHGADGLTTSSPQCPCPFSLDECHQGALVLGNFTVHFGLRFGQVSHDCWLAIPLPLTKSQLALVLAMSSKASSQSRGTR